ncbi:MAG: CYTH domain-containing protein [Erysipelotrichaceae bacterium]|nr:CYTH domain-containing protein [Erysipelotrichaceae bacterium]MBO4537654.1 CYTH domain-containing protein [Erysipelotrichaceae bacterium]
MKGQVELELKTLVSRPDFEKLAAHYQPLNFVRQVNTYFVTKDPSHYAFRIRERLGEKLFTLKQHRDGQVIEYEKAFTGNFFDDPEIRKTLSDFAVFPPYQILGSMVTDRAVYDTGLAELCFDINSYNGQTDYEIEYEVKKPHDHRKAFDEILARENLRYEKSWGSKYKRCLKTKPQQ